MSPAPPSGRCAAQGVARREARRPAGVGDPPLDREGRPAEAETDQKPKADLQSGGIACRRGEGQSAGVKHAADGHDLAGAVFVRDGAGERLRQAPEDILKRNSEGKNLAAKLEFVGVCSLQAVMSFP